MRRTALLGAVPVLSQGIPDSQFTSGTLNCRWWNAGQLGLAMNLGYVMGSFEAVILHAPKATFNRVSSRATYGDYQEGVTELCKAPENATIAVYVMLEIFAGKFKGETGVQINARLVTARRWYDGASQKDGGAK